MKRITSKWRATDGKIHTFIGDGDTVSDCKTAITEQMDAIESDPDGEIAFIELLDAKIGTA